MQWKEFKAKPIFPRPGMQTLIYAKQDMIDDPDIKGKTLVRAEFDRTKGKLSLWASQMKQLADIMAIHKYEKDVLVLWQTDPNNERYVIPKEVTEEQT